MLLHRRNHQRIDLTNKQRALRSLDALGFSCTNAAPGYYYDGSVFRLASANTCRFSAEGGKTGLLVEPSQENVLLYSSENNAAWADTAGATTRSGGNEVISGKTPIGITVAATTDSVHQNIGVFSGGDESFYIIVEQGTGATADIGVYDATGAALLTRVRLTFATGAVSTITGSPASSGAYQINATGPNGGKLFYFYLVTDTSAVGGNNRRVLFYPSTTAVGSNYLCHAQLTENKTMTSPIVTGAASATRNADVITSSTIPSWWSQTQLSVITRHESIFPSDTYRALFTASDGTGDNYVLCAVNGSPVNPTLLVNVAAAGAVSSVPAVNLDPGSSHTLAYSQKTGATFAAGNGTAGANGGQVGAPTISRLDIGNALGVLYHFGGRIFSITMRPVAMSSTELAYHSS